uniref:Uncharacterized protein n=1 Tax=Nymphaea colorata TaxID=210225 RepID=A0A5K0WWQ2_9MAGN
MRVQQQGTLGKEKKGERKRERERE